MTHYICPAPLRDAYKAYEQNGSFSKALSDPEFQKIAMRLGLVATEFFIAYQASLSLPLVAVTGSLLSIPAAVISTGSYLLYEGVTNLFSETVVSFGYAAAGWALIEYSDRFAMGLLELYFTSTKKPDETSTKKPDELPKDPVKVEKVKLDFSAPERGVFGAKAIVDSGKLGTRDVVEFFYSRDDTGENAKAHGPKLTFGGKPQFDYAIFANTAKGEVEIDGAKWLTREHFFNAQKFKKGSATYNAIQKGEGVFASAGDIRNEGKKGEFKGDLRFSTAEGWAKWNDTEAFETLYRANLAFFKQNKEACELLLSTGKTPIVERNNIPDRWGITFRAGKVKYEDSKKDPINRNLQGLILMLVREQLSKA